MGPGRRRVFLGKFHLRAHVDQVVRLALAEQLGHLCGRHGLDGYRRHCGHTILAFFGLDFGIGPSPRA